MITYYVTESLDLVGRGVKQSVDDQLLTIDFSRWLPAGETISALSAWTTSVVTEGDWQADYPFPNPPVAISNTSPLVLAGASIVLGTAVKLLVENGTNGLAYVVSFTATTAPSGIQKRIEFEVAIKDPFVTGASVSPPPALVVAASVVTTSAALVQGQYGTVFVQNGTGAGITITLPPSPVVDQVVDGVDASGNASQHAITWQGAAGAQINNAATYAFTQDYQSASFRWTGSKWVVV